MPRSGTIALGGLAWLAEGGTLGLKLFLVAVNLPLGAWIIWSAARRGFYLDADSTVGRKRLAFSGADLPAIREFLAAARRDLGWAATDAVGTGLGK